MMRPSSKSKVLGLDWDVLLLSLMGLLIAECIAIYLISQGYGKAISDSLTSMLLALANTASFLARWVYKMVGPVIVPLLLILAAEVFAIYKLIRLKASGEIAYAKRELKILEIAEGASPGFGFLGTCIALMATMHNMDPNLNQQSMLKVLLENASSAFGSTVFGITLALAAFMVKEVFKDLQFQPETLKVENDPEGHPRTS